MSGLEMQVRWSARILKIRLAKVFVQFAVELYWHFQMPWYVLSCYQINETSAWQVSEETYLKTLWDQYLMLFLEWLDAV